MIVVSNTSPLNYLVLLQRVDVLPALFGTVVVPPAVMGELARAAAPEIVRSWATHPPAWVRVETPRFADIGVDLDAGEREAIALAEELHADRVLLDESKARRIAQSRGLKVAGTLAILFEAHLEGMLDFGQTIASLRETSFFLDERLVEIILKRIADS